LLAGCGGGYDFPVSPSVQSAEPAAISPGAARRLQFPAEHEFIIHDKASGQMPGQFGSALGQADASADGKAFCRATASKGGRAWGAFLLGTVVVNRSQGPLTASVTCDVQYRYTVNVRAAAGTETAGKLDLILEAKEVRTGAVLFRQPLATLSRYEGDFQWAGQQRVTFRVRLSPSLPCRLVLRGQVRAETGPAGKSEVTIRVDRCTMTVEAPGPVVRISTRGDALAFQAK